MDFLDKILSSPAGAVAGYAPAPVRVPEPSGESSLKPLDDEKDDFLVRLYASGIAGRPQWKDESVPLGERVNDFLSVNAAAGRSFDDLAPEAERRFDLKPVQLMDAYDSARMKQGARERHRGDEEGVGEFLARRSVPFYSAVRGFVEAKSYHRAARRIAAGKPEEGDHDTVAEYEQRQKNESEKSFGGKAASALARVPAMVGEFAGVTGLVRGGLALAGRGAAGAGAAATPTLAGTEAALAAANRGLLGTMVRGAVSAAPYTPLVPSMYLEDWGQRGGEWKLEQLGSALAHGVLTLSVLGATGAGAQGALAGGGLTRLFGAAGVGTATSIGALGPLNKILKLRTDYGTLQHLLDGEGGKFLEAAAIETMVFTAFGVAHRGWKAVERPNVPHLEAMRDVLRDAKERGLSEEQAGRELLSVSEPLSAATVRGSVRSRADAQKFVQQMQMDREPLHRFGMELAQQYPVDPGPARPGTPAAVFSAMMEKGASLEQAVGEMERAFPDLFPAAGKAPATMKEAYEQQLARGVPPAEAWRLAERDMARLSEEAELEEGIRQTEIPPQRPERFGRKTMLATEAPESPPARRPRPEPMTPEEAERALAKEEARQKVEGKNAARRVEQEKPPEPGVPEPFEGIPDEAVLATAKGLGLSAAGGRKAVVARMLERVGPEALGKVENALRAVEGARPPPRQQPAPTTPAVADPIARLALEVGFSRGATEGMVELAQRKGLSFEEAVKSIRKRFPPPPGRAAAPPPSQEPFRVEPSPEEGAEGTYQLRQGEAIVGRISLGRASARGMEAESARGMFPDVVKEGETVSRIHEIEIDDPRMHGKGLGQQLYLEGMRRHGADWYYNSQADPGAVNALEALARKGLVELRWRGGPGSIHLVRVKAEGRPAASAEPPPEAPPRPEAVPRAWEETVSRPDGGEAVLEGRYRLGRTEYRVKGSGGAWLVSREAALATQEAAPPVEPAPTSELTGRQQYVLDQRELGRSLGDIAREMGVTPEAVSKLEAKALAKLGRTASVAREQQAERESRAEVRREQGKAAAGEGLRREQRTRVRLSPEEAALDRIAEKLANGEELTPEENRLIGLGEEAARAQEQEETKGVEDAVREGKRAGLSEGKVRGNVEATLREAEESVQAEAETPEGQKAPGPRENPRRRSEGEYAYQNRLRREANATTLADEIARRGGLDPEAFGRDYDLEAARAEFGDVVFRSKGDKRRGGKKGTLRPDEFAEELARSGKIPPVPEDTTPSEHLVQLLREHHLIDPGKWPDVLVAREAARAPDLPAPRTGPGDAVEPEGVAVPAAEEVAPGVYFHTPDTARRAAATGEPAPGQPSGVGPFEVNATIDALLDIPSYVERRGPYGSPAAALTREGAVVTGRMAAGDPLIHMEEVAHLLTKGAGMELDPARLPAEVVEGFRRFFSPAQPPPASERLMVEGVGQWAVRRMTGELNDLTPPMRAAAEYAERWAGEQKGLTEALDRVRGVYQQMAGQGAVGQAAGLLSATGAPAEPVGLTVKERVAGAWQRLSDWWVDNVTNDLAVLQRAGMGKAYKAWSRLLYADEPRAQQWGQEGVGTLVDGKYTVIGPSKARITEGLLPEDLAPVVERAPGWWGKAKEFFEHPEQVSRASLFATARHVIDEAAQGRPVVPEEQLRTYQEAMAEFQKDPAFVKRATAFADRLTQAYNATLEALAAPEVHRLSPETVAYLKEKRPTYVPTTRVREDVDWRKSGAAGRGEKMPAFLHERTGSGEQIVDPLVNYEARLRQMASQWNEQMRRNAVAEYLLQDGMGEWALRGEVRPGEEPDDPYAERVPWPKDGRKATWFWYGPEGKLQNFRIADRALYDLLTHQQGDSNSVAQFFRWMGKLGFNTPWGRVEPLRQSTELVRKGATVFSLAFQLRNVGPTRDWYEFTRNTVDQASTLQVPASLARAYAFEAALLAGKVPQDVVFELFARERGRQQRMFAFEGTPVAGEVRSNLEMLKQVLNTMGAGELGPRFLEFRNRLKQLGWPEAKLEAELKKARQAQAEGRPYQDPVPWEVLQDAMEAANEVTTPFSRQGIVTREVNKLVPFFGPAVSGMAKALRNWRTNTKGAAIALGGFLALKAMHWMAVSDEDWYRELSPRDRYQNFVVPLAGKLWRIPGARDLEVPVGGFLTTMLDAAYQRNPNFKAMLAESFEAVTPPLPLPPVVNVAQQQMRNETRLGVPIIPRRDEDLPAGHLLTRYRIPHALQELTGGRAVVKGDVGESLGESARRALVPFSEVKNARESVNSFYERFKDLEGERALARRKGLAFGEEREYQRLSRAESELRDLGRQLRGARLVGRRVVEGEEPSEDRKRQIRQRMVEVARRALGTSR